MFPQAQYPDAEAIPTTKRMTANSLAWARRAPALSRALNDGDESVLLRSDRETPYDPCHVYENASVSWLLRSFNLISGFNPAAPA